ncbi:MAG: head-tail adaptor protein [Bacteroides sp.]|nr:head-tail adaptor protein [Bacteroides sp.]
MQAGLLRDTVVFEQARKVKTDSGFREKEYVPILTTKAYKKKLSLVGGDGINAYEEFLGNTVILQVRWNPAISEDLRIDYQGRKYKIKLLDKQSDNTYIITCSKEDE